MGTAGLAAASQVEWKEKTVGYSGGGAAAARTDPGSVHTERAVRSHSTAAVTGLILEQPQQVDPEEGGGGRGGEGGGYMGTKASSDLKGAVPHFSDLMT